MSRERRIPSLWVPALLLTGLIIFVAALCALARPDGDLPAPVRSHVQ
ncbi:MAG: hypothetical protein Q8R97_07490 [Brevundimonas sp.]|nr:hypothetical protein [Brevundimonas sp.]